MMILYLLAVTKNLRVPGVYERFRSVLCHAAFLCEVFQNVFATLTS